MEVCEVRRVLGCRCSERRAHGCFTSPVSSLISKCCLFPPKFKKYKTPLDLTHQGHAMFKEMSPCPTAGSATGRVVTEGRVQIPDTDTLQDPAPLSRGDCAPPCRGPSPCPFSFLSVPEISSAPERRMNPQGPGRTWHGHAACHSDMK